MFPVTITLHNDAQLSAVLAALRAPAPVLTEADAQADLVGKPRPSRAPKAETPKAETPKAETPKAETPKAEPTTSTPTPAAASPEPATPAASTASSDAPAALDYDRDVRPLIIKLGAVKSRDAVVAVLGMFGVAKGTDLSAEQLADAKAALEAALGA